MNKTSPGEDIFDILKNARAFLERSILHIKASERDISWKIGVHLFPSALIDLAVTSTDVQVIKITLFKEQNDFQAVMGFKIDVNHHQRFGAPCARARRDSCLFKLGIKRVGENWQQRKMVSFKFQMDVLLRLHFDLFIECKFEKLNWI